MMKSIIILIVLLYIQLYMQKIVDGGNIDLNYPDNELTSSPIRTNIEGMNSIQTSKKRRSDYQEKKQEKIARLEKVGVETEVAKKVVGQYYSNLQKNWKLKNEKRYKEIKRNSYHKRYDIRKDNLNQRRKERYRERKATEPEFINQMRNRNNVNTIQERHDARVRSNVKKGMSEEKAVQEAEKYITGFREKSSQRLKDRRNAMKQSDPNDSSKHMNVVKTVQERREAKIRKNIKQGMTKTKAAEEADKYIDQFRDKNSQRMRTSRQKTKQKASLTREVQAKAQENL